MALYVTLDDLPRGISSTRAARENVANYYPSPCPTACASDVLTIARAYNHFVRRTVYYSRRPRDTSCEYRDCDTDGTESFSVMAVIIRGILPL